MFHNILVTAGAVVFASFGFLALDAIGILSLPAWIETIFTYGLGLGLFTGVVLGGTKFLSGRGCTP